jgi:hypothetical protein
MKVIVTGSRDWPDEQAVSWALFNAWAERKCEVFQVMHGGCPTGADAYASAWCTKAKALGLLVVETVFEADWSRGRKAGPERNRRMIEAGADKVLAFNRNNSRGTSGTIRLAAKAGIPVDLCIIRDEGVS